MRSLQSPNPNFRVSVGILYTQHRTHTHTHTKAQEKGELRFKVTVHEFEHYAELVRRMAGAEAQDEIGVHARPVRACMQSSM